MFVGLLEVGRHFVASEARVLSFILSLSLSLPL
jgi:hypothetical protein